jgi:phage-related protein
VELDRPLVWLHGEVRTPPLSKAARSEVGLLLRRLQEGETIGLPESRPMPSIGRRCHELRVQDVDHTWRIVYRIDDDAIVILEVFAKKSRETPRTVIAACHKRLRDYDSVG